MKGETRPREKVRKPKGGRAAIVALKDYANHSTFQQMIPEIPAHMKRGRARRS